MNRHWQFINRHTETEKHWWRLRLSTSAVYRTYGAMLSTGGGGYDESDKPHNILTLAIGGRYLGLLLPGWIKPYTRTKFYTPDGQDEPRSYTETFRREFGFRAGDGAIHFHYGEQVMEWPGDKSKVWFYPWRETTHIRHSLYDEAGALFATFTDDKMWGDSYEARKAIEAACPVRLFLFAENDGDLRVAQCRIEEREWRRGGKKGLWRWLLAWKRNMVRRSLAIEYSDEVGRRKGSWKGGTIGCSIDMEKDELPIEAFTRHCKKEGLHFIADVTELKKTDLCQDLTFAQIGKAISSLGPFLAGYVQAGDADLPRRAGACFRQGKGRHESVARWTRQRCAKRRRHRHAPGRRPCAFRARHGRGHDGRRSGRRAMGAAIGS